MALGNPPVFLCLSESLEKLSHPTISAANDDSNHKRLTFA